MHIHWLNLILLVTALIILFVGCCILFSAIDQILMKDDDHAR